MIRNLNLRFIHSSAKNAISSISPLTIRYASNTSAPVRYHDTQTKSAFLVENTGMPRKKAISLIESNDKFRLKSLEFMKLSFDMLKNTGYHFAVEKHPELLCINSTVMKNRILLMEDCGFNKEKIPELILHFNLLPNKKLSSLKNFQLLPKTVNIIENFFHICEIPLTENTVECDDWNTFREIYRKFCKFYIQRELGLSDEQTEKISKTMKYISIRYLKYNIKFMRDVFHIPNDDIRCIKQLLHADPNSILHIFNTQKHRHIKEVIQKKPKLVTIPPEIISRNQQILREKNIPEQTRAYPSLLALTTELNANRLSKALETHELQDYADHPRFNELISHSHVVHERLDILKQLNMRCFTLNQLTGPNELFLRHISHGIDKVRNNDKFTLLTQELPQYTKPELRRRLFLNPYVGYIPLHIIRETLTYLKSVEFSAEDIFISLPLVLYHKKVVQNAVEISVPKLLKSMNHPDDYDMVKFKPYLPLALYSIEKIHNFTGDGVWTQEDQSKGVDLFNE